MPSINLILNVHQPVRLNQDFSFFDIGSKKSHLDKEQIVSRLERVSQRCYFPANNILKKLLTKYEGKFKFSFSISGTILDYLENYFPELLVDFQHIVSMKGVDLVGQPYYHSVSAFYSEKEFIRQIKLHKNRTYSLFDKKVKVFKNTGLSYNNQVGQLLNQLKFKGVFTEGTVNYLNNRSLNLLYHLPNYQAIKILLRNQKISELLTNEFSANRASDEHALSAEDFARLAAAEQGQVLNIFIDYEKLFVGFPPRPDIVDFFERWVENCIEHQQINFTTSTKVVEKLTAERILDVHHPISAIDQDKDFSAWTSNAMQKSAIARVYALEKIIKKADYQALWDLWGELQTADHFYHMTTKPFFLNRKYEDFSPYKNPYHAYINYTNILSDLEIWANEYIALKEQNKLFDMLSKT